MSKGSIIIWGELLPNTHTGISVSNHILLQSLHQNKIFPIILEEYSWNKRNLGKIIHFLQICFRLFKTICRNKIRIFYFTLPQSVLGGLKFLFVLPVVKILSRRTIIKAHIHRGDFGVFTSKNISGRLITRCDFWFIDEIIALSPLFAKDVEAFSKKVKVRVLHNTSSYESSERRDTRSYRKEFICISNYIKSKGLLELVNCFGTEALKDCKLEIYGHAYDNGFIQKLKLEAKQNVSINGHLERTDILEKLNGSDCLVMPSNNEGQPIVIIEAMSMAIPVVAKNVGDIPNLLGMDYKFLAQSNNYESLFQTLVAFDRYEDKTEISGYLYQRYFDYYSNERYRIKLLDIIN